MGDGQRRGGKRSDRDDREFTRERIEDWCRSRPEQDERLDLTIIDNETGQFVGEAVLNDFDAATDTCAFRIAVRRPAWFGRGFGTEATRLIVAHGLDTIGLSSISLEWARPQPWLIPVSVDTEVVDSPCAQAVNAVTCVYDQGIRVMRNGGWPS